MGARLGLAGNPVGLVRTGQALSGPDCNIGARPPCLPLAVRVEAGKLWMQFLYTVGFLRHRFMAEPDGQVPRRTVRHHHKGAFSRMTGRKASSWCIQAGGGSLRWGAQRVGRCGSISSGVPRVDRAEHESQAVYTLCVLTYGPIWGLTLNLDPGIRRKKRTPKRPFRVLSD